MLSSYDLLSIYRRVGSCCLEGVLDIKGSTKSKHSNLDIGGTTSHGKWSYGSATITGQSGLH